jgi:hypothetical protein
MLSVIFKDAPRYGNSFFIVFAAGFSGGGVCAGWRDGADFAGI